MEHLPKVLEWTLGSHLGGGPVLGSIQCCGLHHKPIAIARPKSPELPVNRIPFGDASCRPAATGMLLLAKRRGGDLDRCNHAKAPGLFQQVETDFRSR
jgi:hypothetical protein